MSKETLKVMRLIIPGVLIFLLCMPLGKLTFATLTKIDTGNAFYLAIVLVLGGLYRTFNARRFLFHDQLTDVHKNIKDKLLAPFVNEQIYSKLNNLPERDFLKVFYNIIDNDPSLSSKKADVYENGLLWSSYADLGTISIFASPIYCLAFALMRNYEYLAIAVFLLGLFFLSKFLSAITARNHIKLSDDQLETITVIHRQKLNDLLQKLAE
jgi:hypothetical protein